MTNMRGVWHGKNLGPTARSLRLNTCLLGEREDWDWCVLGGAGCEDVVGGEAPESRRVVTITDEGGYGWGPR